MMLRVKAFAPLLRVALGYALALGSAAAGAATLLVFGDSLSSGYGLPRERGWVALLAERLRSQRFDYTVVNASISGETTSGGAGRIEAALKQHRPAIVILALGGNDGLRGANLEAMRQNLEAMIEASRRARARVLLVGAKLPPNYGAVYAEKFQAVFADVARQHRAAFVPFLLEGFAENRELFQEDGIHPAAAAQPRMLENVWRGLRPLLEKR